MKKLTASLMIILSAFTDPELTLSQLIWNIGLSLSANHKPKSFRNPVEELRSYIDLDDIKENDKQINENQFTINGKKYKLKIYQKKF